MGDHRDRGTAGVPLTERLVALARTRRPDDEVLPPFLEAYYRELPEFDVDDRSDADLYAAAVRHWGVGLTRSEHATAVTILSPDRDRDGWQSDRSFVHDRHRRMRRSLSTRCGSRSSGTTSRRTCLVHPMLHVGRDAAGRIVGVGGSGSDPTWEVEAWTLVEIDRCEGATADALRDDLVSAIALTHRVVSDFAPMRDRMLDHAGLDPLLGWLAGGHFVFLGASTFEVHGQEAVRRSDLATSASLPRTRSSTPRSISRRRTSRSLGRPPSRSCTVRAA